MCVSVGFLMKSRAPSFFDPFPGFRLNIAGNHDGHHRQIFLANLFQHLVAVHLRHVEVQEHQLSLVPPQLLQCFHTVFRETDVPAQSFWQGSGHLLSGQGRVVADQNAGGH